MKASMRMVHNRLGLRPRIGQSCGADGGCFKYVDSATNRCIEFQWDGAGIDRFGKVVLIEEEESQPNQMHIHAHLARIILMVGMGENISKVVWVVREEDVDELVKIVETWKIFHSRISTIKLPPFYYLSPDGYFLYDSDKVKNYGG